MGMFSRKKMEPAAERTPAASPQTPPTNEQPEVRQAPPAAPRKLIESTPKTGGEKGCSVINSHLWFDGNLKFEGTLTVDCEIRGSITTTDTLVVGPSAKVNAEITAGTVEIAGKVQGNIRAKSCVKIHTGGEVYGNIETPTVSMEEGVVFEGNCTRPRVQQPRPKYTSPPVTTTGTSKTATGTPTTATGTPTTATAPKGTVTVPPVSTSAPKPPYGSTGQKPEQKPEQKTEQKPEPTGEKKPSEQKSSTTTSKTIQTTNA